MDAEVISHEEQIIESLMPASGKIEDFVFGPNHRKEGETFEDYKIRLKTEHYVYKLRMNKGVNTWYSDKGAFVDPAKQQRKTLRKMRKANLRQSFREYKTRFSGRMSDKDVLDISAPF